METKADFSSRLLLQWQLETSPIDQMGSRPRPMGRTGRGGRSATASTRGRNRTQRRGIDAQFSGR